MASMVVRCRRVSYSLVGLGRIDVVDRRLRRRDERAVERGHGGGDLGQRLLTVERGAVIEHLGRDERVSIEKVSTNVE